MGILIWCLEAPACIFVAAAGTRLVVTRVRRLLGPLTVFDASHFIDFTSGYYGSSVSISCNEFGFDGANGTRINSIDALLAVTLQTHHVVGCSSLSVDYDGPCILEPELRYFVRAKSGSLLSKWKFERQCGSWRSVDVEITHEYCPTTTICVDQNLPCERSADAATFFTLS